MTVVMFALPQQRGTDLHTMRFVHIEHQLKKAFNRILGVCNRLAFLETRRTLTSFVMLLNAQNLSRSLCKISTVLSEQHEYHDSLEFNT